ncbi:hypothetical protein RCO48_22470 [Peribacillus frigoritolerans]|nr:hypothetical protein [Peribacillus frigoritolerans]
MFELSEKEKHHIQIIDNFKQEIENYTQTIDFLSEQESQYKVNIENLETGDFRTKGKRKLPSTRNQSVK